MAYQTERTCSSKTTSVLLSRVGRGRDILEDELQKIELTIQTLADASIQVADDAPDNPRKGMVHYAVSGWDPWRRLHGSHGLQRQRLGGSIRNQHNVYLLEPVCGTSLRRSWVASSVAAQAKAFVAT